MQKCLKKYNLKNYYYSKFFTTDGKIKTNDLNAKNKQFSVNAFFTDENPQNTKTQSSHLSFDSNNYDKKENDDETVQFIEKIIDNIEKKKNDDPNPFKAKENPYNTNKVNIFGHLSFRHCLKQLFRRFAKITIIKNTTH